MCSETWNHQLRSGSFEVTGTMVNYYSVCKRKLWLFSRGISKEQDSSLVSLGRLLHEKSYARSKKEILLNRIKLDHISFEDQLLIHEVKKSRAHSDAARLQLMFYLYELEKMGIVCSGVLHFRGERRKETVAIDDDAKSLIEDIISDIKTTVYDDVPPKTVRTKSCRKCAYYDYCFG